MGGLKVGTQRHSPLWPLRRWRFGRRNGGRGGIRTPDTLAGTPVFKTGAINHSATLPEKKFSTAAQVAQSDSAQGNRMNLFRGRARMSQRPSGARGLYRPRPQGSLFASLRVALGYFHAVPPGPGQAPQTESTAFPGQPLRFLQGRPGPFSCRPSGTRQASQAE